MARLACDIGHGFNNTGNGRHDPGAVLKDASGKVIATEYEEAKAVVLLTVPILRAHGHTVKVFDGGPYHDRARLADKWGAQFFLSVHLNAHSRTATGTETFVHTQPPQTSRRVAANVQRKLVAALQLPNRGVKACGFAVLSGKCAAALAELVFISNPDDLARLRARRQRVAQALADALLDEFGRKAAPVQIPEPKPEPKEESEMAEHFIVAGGHTKSPEHETYDPEWDGKFMAELEAVCKKYRKKPMRISVPKYTYLDDRGLLSK